jgi:hypothetical protein
VGFAVRNCRQVGPDPSWGGVDPGALRVTAINYYGIDEQVHEIALG